MGYDFSSHHVFAGDDDVDEIRGAVRECICQTLPFRVSNEKDATRSIVIGPPGRWILVGDSAGSTERRDPVALADLALALSTVAPTMTVKMSDSAIIHLLLYKEGRLSDKFGNGTFPWFRFESDDEAAPFRGDIDKWKPLLTSPDLVDDLRRSWSQDGDAVQIIGETARLLGVDGELIQVGYSVFDEADEIKYTQWLADSHIDRDSFDELYFASEHQ